MKKERYQVTGMSCAACSAAVERGVNKLEGLQSVQVNLLRNVMDVEYDPEKLDSAAIIAAVEKAGYGASLQGAEAAPAAKQAAANDSAEKQKTIRTRLWVSFGFLLPLFYISMGHMMGWPLPHFFHGTENALILAFTQMLLCLPIMYVNRKFFINGFGSLFRGSPNMDSLIALGSSAAMVYGIFAIYHIGWGLGHGDLAMVDQYRMDLYFEAAGMILTLITVGKLMEERSKGRTSDALSRLMDLAPPTANVIRGGAEQTIPAEQVVVGDTVVVRPGQSIPVDGIILKGSSWVDESAITGESVPAEKTEGDTVTSATLNTAGYLEIRATRVGSDTTLSQIIHLVEEAGASKAPIARMADKISGVFVPIVLCIALASTLIWLLVGKDLGFAVSCGIAVLVVSCPCALGLATPTAIMVGTGRGAEQGILFRSAEVLENTRNVDTVVLDKTGTITEGKPKVTDVVPAPDVDAGELVRLAAALEQPSEHPLGKAVCEYAAAGQVEAPVVQNFEALPGRGVTALLEGATLRSGKPELLEGFGVNTAELADRAAQLANQGKTPLWFAKNGELLGIIAVADTPRQSSAEAIKRMEEMGLEVIMLTGDNQRTAEAIGKQLGLNGVIAGVLPQDKEAEIRKLQEQGRHVAMVGDGINDAPALARADVGFAIGAGSDIAISSADVILLKNDLRDVTGALSLSRAVMRNIKQNLFWALFYNSLGIPLAAGLLFPLFAVKLNPMFGAAAMSLSSFCVVTNALRLRFFRFERDNTPSENTPAPVAHEPAGSNNTVRSENKMEKVMKIEGMMCMHCSGRVEKVLNDLEGVEAKVDLEAATATVQIAEGSPVDEQKLIDTVTEAGYKVLEVR